jgi:signal transduction histidine kinase
LDTHTQSELEPTRLPASWLFEHARDSLLVVDAASGHVTSANRAARALFGWPAGEQPEVRLEALVAEAARPAVRGALEACLDDAASPAQPVEVAVLGATEETIPVALVVDRPPDDRLCVLVSLRDLRERARVIARRDALLRVARLAAQSDVNELFEALLAEAIAVLHADDGGIARWEAEAGVLRQAYTFLPSASAGAVLDARRSASGRAASERKPIIINDYQHEVGAATPAGRVGAQSVAAVPLVYEGGLLGTLSVTRFAVGEPFAVADAELLEMLASTASATLVGLERNRHLRLMVEQLERAKEAAEAADRAKSTFLATMSHELRTPLNAILGYCDLLIEEAVAREAQALVPDLDRIGAAGRELLGLIDSVLDLSEIESGALRLRRERLAVVPLIEEVAAAARQLVDRRGNSLTLQCEADLGEVWADPARVRQVLLSLLDNASKFTSGGRLRLEAARRREDGQEWLQVRVADTGIGMTSEQLQLASAPFWQADGTSTRRHTGAGLGLALTSRLCALMGGTLLAESQPGVGTVITVRLPA